MANDDLKVVAVRRNAEGAISDFKMNTGLECTFEETKQLIHDGKLNLQCVVGKGGSEVIRSKPDGDESTNLSNLPEF